jgi:hypothetical protein
VATNPQPTADTGKPQLKPDTRASSVDPAPADPSDPPDPWLRPIAYLLIFVLITAGWLTSFLVHDWQPCPAAITPPCPIVSSTPFICVQPQSTCMRVDDSAVILKSLVVVALAFLVSALFPYTRMKRFELQPGDRNIDTLTKEVLPKVKEEADQSSQANEELSSADRDAAAAKVSLNKAKDRTDQADRLVASTKEATIKATQAITAMMQLREIASVLPERQTPPVGQEGGATDPVALAQIWESNLRSASAGRETHQAAADQAQQQADAANQTLEQAQAAANKASTKQQDAKKASDAAALAQQKADTLENFSKIWPKLSQPEYAIGLGVLSKDDYQALVSKYQTLSTTIIGLVVPAALLVIIGLIRIGGFYPGYAQGGLFAWTYILLGAGETALFFAAADLKHKFEMSTQSMIASSYAKLLAAKKNSSGGSATAKSVGDQITAALKAATIVKKTDLQIVPSDSKPPAPPSPPSPSSPPSAPSSPAPTSSPSTPSPAVDSKPTDLIVLPADPAATQPAPSAAAPNASQANGQTAKENASPNIPKKTGENS